MADHPSAEVNGADGVLGGWREYGASKSPRRVWGCGAGQVPRCFNSSSPWWAAVIVCLVGGGNGAGVGCVCGGLWRVWWRGAGNARRCSPKTPVRIWATRSVSWRVAGRG